MEASFWHKCWENNHLGFHQEDVHPWLIDYLPKYIKSTDQHVFVPLCGKSLDMYWLAGYMSVSGSELSEIACQDFFIEKKLNYHQQKIEDFNLFSYDNITLYQGDFFKLTAKHFARIGPVDWIYDRAALIALPAVMQQSYIKHLLSFFDQGTRILLISLEYPTAEMSGPPFSLTSLDIEQLFLTADKRCNIECLATRELKDKRFAQRTFKVSALVEKLYLITR